MPQPKKLLLSGNEALAHAALTARVRLGAGYPGTPSTEILENLAALGGPAQWSPNEKVALEVAIGAAYAGARALATMKHVGLNVAADPLFTATYTGVTGGLVIAVADDPGMHSSQNEQDTRRLAIASGAPLLEPADSQETYDATLLAFELSERWGLPVILRLTTRVSHGRGIVHTRPPLGGVAEPHFERNIAARVMIPSNARPAHRRLREKLDALAAWNETEGPVQTVDGACELGIVATGVAYMHAREAAPEASFIKPLVTVPLPIERIRAFAARVKRCVVVEEGDPVMAETLRAAGIAVDDKPTMYRFGELNVERVRRILASDTSPEAAPPKGRPPQLCPGCPHRVVFEALGRMGCIVAGDIGCYALGALPPFSAMDTCLCMGSSVGIGLGMRQVLPPEEARRVVSVIGDSTFVHSGITGVAEMAYNLPPGGHLVMILDNGTTAMTGLQEHPGTGRSLAGEPAARIDYDTLCQALGAETITIENPDRDVEGFEKAVRAALDNGKPTVMIVRRPCILSAKKQKKTQIAK